MSTIVCSVCGDELADIREAHTTYTTPAVKFFTVAEMPEEAPVDRHAMEIGRSATLTPGFILRPKRYPSNGWKWYGLPLNPRRSLYAQPTRREPVRLPVMVTCRRGHDNPIEAVDATARAMATTNVQAEMDRELEAQQNPRPGFRVWTMGPGGLEEKSD